MSTTDTISELLPATVKELVETTGKSDSTVRKALKELGAVKNDDGQFEVPEVKPRANHGYARNTSESPKADQRDADVAQVLEAEGAAELKDIAEALSITVRAARHAIWRMTRRGQVERDGKSYSLVEGYEPADEEDEADAA